MPHCLLSACQAGNFSIFSSLLETSADPDAVNSVVCDNGLSLLHHAVQGGSIEILEALLNYPYLVVDPVDHGGQTPLLLACSQGRDKVTRLLVKSTVVQVDVNKRCYQGFTPLIAASMAGFRFCVKVSPSIELTFLLFGIRPCFPVSI